MVFNTISFLIFFPVFFAVYWWLSSRYSLKARNVFILLGSYFFYGWWDWRFLGLIIISSVADFFIGNLLHLSKQADTRKRLLWLSVGINLGILGFFKYYNFFIDSLAFSLSGLGVDWHTTTLSIILPVGISFYTFQSMTYTIDIYRKQLQPTKDAVAFLSYVAFFPQLVAGPIERAKSLLPQFFERPIFDYTLAVSGLRLVLWGFFKKVVIADNLGLFVDEVFSKPDAYGGGFLLIAILGFAFQIYCDFSGYSDIAIGLARLLGFRLHPNFKTPYFATSLQDFWRRWHISLSTWFRDYVYIPLGGGRVKPPRWAVNVILTFTISGLWHGASINFLLWGFLHGLALWIERSISPFGTQRLRYLRGLMVFLVVTILWLPFRAFSFENLVQIIAQMDSLHLSKVGLNNLLQVNLGGYKWIGFVTVFIGFLVLEWQMQLKDFSQLLNTYRQPIRIALYYLLLIAILLLGNFDVAPSFIYFQF